MSIAANRFPHIRAALIDNALDAAVTGSITTPTSSASPRIMSIRAPRQNRGRLSRDRF